MADIEYLEEERKKLWAKVTDQDAIIKNLVKKLEEAEKQIKENNLAINNRMSDDEKVAKQASRETSRFRNMAKEKCDEVDALKQRLEEEYKNLQQLVTENIESKKSVNAQFKAIEDKNNKIQDAQNELLNSKEALQPIMQTIQSASTVLEKITNLKNNIESNYTATSDKQKKVEELYDTAIRQKDEIIKIKRQIAGYKQTNKETGEEEQVNGIKQNLEETFDELTSQIENTQEELATYQENKNTEVETFITNMQVRYDELIKRIEGLLPEAMTAGLSHAYYEKKIVEIEERDKAYDLFRNSLIWMFVVAIIPVGITCYMFWGLKFDVQTIINDTPKIMSAVLALYAPIFWLAYSANKRMNLSKRLIEEYTYKEALSKTFEGLSKQIENIGDKNTAEDLKAKLLYIIVSMNSENPGKLIKGYNKPDHPIMDIINNSVKLTDSIQNLANTPILGHLCSPIFNYVNEQRDLQNRKVETGLKANEIINTKSTPEDDDEE